MKAETPESLRKAAIDAVILQLPNASAKKISGLDAYFVNGRMFACISGKGVGLRVPVSIARDLQFSRGNVVPFQPTGVPSSKEWIQIDREDAAEYAQDADLFRISLEFVGSGRVPAS
jgi:hypothetical protein